MILIAGDFPVESLFLHYLTGNARDVEKVERILSVYRFRHRKNESIKRYFILDAPGLSGTSLIYGRSLQRGINWNKHSVT